MEEYNMLLCNVCELFFIDPYPYDCEKRYAVMADDNSSEIDILKPSQHYLARQRYYKDIFPFIEKECQGAKSALDIGCGTGYLLELLDKKYPNMYRVGIELNTARAKFAEKHAACSIHQVPIEEFSTDIKFDLITLIDVLSHITSFDKLFKSIRSLLSENGKVILKVGEICRDAKKGSIYNWGVPDHVHFLGMSTMEFLSKKYRFVISSHRRVLFSDELFTRSNFKTPGRSLMRNIIKASLAYMPFALRFLKILYNIKYGQKVYSSFIVLTQSPQ